MAVCVCVVWEGGGENGWEEEGGRGRGEEGIREAKCVGMKLYNYIKYSVLYDVRV